MFKIIALILLGLAALLAYSYFYMKKARGRLFKRVAAFTSAEVAGYSAKFRDYLPRDYPGIARSSLEDTAPLMEQLLKNSFSYMRIDRMDGDAMVFAIGCYLGERLAGEHGARWEQSEGSGPALIFGQDETQVTMHPVEKAASFREFGDSGDLHAYIIAAREIACEMNVRALPGD